MPGDGSWLTVLTTPFCVCEDLWDVSVLSNSDFMYVMCRTILKKTGARLPGHLKVAPPLTCDFRARLGGPMRD